MGWKESDIPRDVLRKLLEADAANNPPAKEPKAKKFVHPCCFRIEAAERLVVFVAVETKNETNERQWKAKNRRAGAAWKAVREAIGGQLGLLEPFARAYASDKALRVTFTRLGGRRLDQLCNLGAACKGVEDAIAYLLGADDGDPRWDARAEQEPGELVGVRIEVEIKE